MSRLSCLALLAAGLPALADDGHSAPMLEPDGLWTGETLAMPGPPADCRATIIVEQGKALCQDDRLPALVDNERMEAVAAHSQDPSKLPTWYQTAGSPEQGIGCAFSCDPLTGLARWVVKVETPGYRGAVRCAVGEVASLALELGEVGGPVPVGAGAMWLTDLSHVAFNFSFPEDGQYSPKELTGDNLCPAGQPTREGGVVGAFSGSD